MAIGIISAMPEEIDLILSEMELEEKVHSGMRDYFLGKIHNQNVVAVFSRCGKVASAVTTTELITKFDIEQIIFVGVAGGLQPKVEIGDVVIADQLYQHDMDASPIFPKLEIPLLNKKAFQADPGTTYQLKEACEQMIEKWNDTFDNQILEEFQIHKPQIHLGEIASGDQFISNSADREIVSLKLPKALCVEMEGAAVAQVCYEYGVPFGVVRIISDSANEHAAVHFQKFMDRVASVYSLEIIKNYLEVLSSQN